MSEHLTSEVAQKALLADVANILQKAKSGKPLTKYERDLIASTAKTAPEPEPEAPAPEQPTKSKAKPTTGAPRWTLLAASVELGRSRETIRRGLAANGVATKSHYTTKEIFDALNGGDLEAEKILKTREERIALERENRIANGEVIPLADNLRWQENVLQVVRQRLLSLPATMAQRCNPSDPAFSQKALDGWVAETLPILRTAVQQTPTEQNP
jgi:hypothetical protein